MLGLKLIHVSKRGYKPLPKPILIFHLWRSLAFTSWQFWKEIPKIPVNEMHLTIMHLKFQPDLPGDKELTHWGRVMHVCISNSTIIGSDDGLSPGWRQDIIWTNVIILLIRTLGTNFSEILNEIHTFSFKKMHVEMSSAKRHPFRLGLIVLNGMTT